MPQGIRPNPKHGPEEQEINLAKLIDHTLLKPDATEQQIVELCREARTYGFAAVCVNPVHVYSAARLLYGAGISVATVIGFPLGATFTHIKVQEVLAAKAYGAREVDIVANIGWIKAHAWDKVKSDLLSVVETAHSCDLIAKVIIETGLLSEAEKEQAAHLVAEVGADYIKTSTGFAPGGATVEDVRKLRAWLPEAVKIKASGGIRTREFALELVRAGASRIGTSAGVKLVEAQG